MKEKEIIYKANQIVTEYSEGEFSQAFKKLRKEQSGFGCGCWNCAKNAVDEYNSWLEWMSNNSREADDNKYQIQPKGNSFEIVRNGDLKSQPTRHQTLKGGTDNSLAPPLPLETD